MNSLRANNILETCLCVDDLDAAENFYCSVLGLKLHSKVEYRHVFLICGNRMLLLFNALATQVAGEIPAHGTMGAGHVAFEMEEEDYADWIQKLQKNGIAIEKEMTWPEGGKSIYFRDPSGNCLELATRSLWF